jgi:hypothetical protein
MASVNETIVREYFEGLGFLIRQPRKYQIAVRSDQSLREEVDMLALNPEPAPGPAPAPGLWGPEDLRHVVRAVVGVRGWHTERFSPAVLRQAPEVYRFASDDVVAELQTELGGGPVARILCLSDLPASPTLQKESLQVLQEQGIDGVLLFSHMLRQLISDIQTQRNYEKSDLLQLLRILKSYDLVNSEQ